MKRVISILLCFILVIGGAGILSAAAASYRPIMILERMGLSKELTAPFDISKADNEVTPLAAGAIENDSKKGKVLHISDRKSCSAGLSVNLKELQQKTGDLSFSYNGKTFVNGEYYSLTFSIRAAKGKSFYIMPVMGGGGTIDKSGKQAPDNNGYLGNPEARFKVTDQWTTVGITADGELTFFIGDNTYQVYQPNPSSWCGLYFVTFTDPDKRIWDSPCTEDYYITDFCFWGPKALESTADGFVDGVSRLPAKDQVSRNIEAAVEQLEKIHKGLSASDRQRSDVVRAKSTLDNVKSIMKTIRRPFKPQYTYKEKENLLAPCGELESFDGSTYIWMEPSSGKPKFTLVENASTAKQGKKCLLISERESRSDLSVDITPIVRDNGGGKYYFSCWMKTKERGVSMEVLPLVLYVGSDGKVKEYEIGEYVVTDEWTFVGVTIQEADRYFANDYEGLDDIDGKINYAVLRFYSTDMEGDEEGNPFPDFYIDDLKFWKDSEKLPGYVPTSSSPADISSADAGLPADESQIIASEPQASADDTSSQAKPESSGGTLGLMIGIAVGMAVLGGLFVLFWFVIRPKMLAAATAQDAEEKTDPTVAGGPETDEHSDKRGE